MRDEGRSLVCHTLEKTRVWSNSRGSGQTRIGGLVPRNQLLCSYWLSSKAVAKFPICIRTLVPVSQEILVILSPGNSVAATVIPRKFGRTLTIDRCITQQLIGATRGQQLIGALSTSMVSSKREVVRNLVDRVR